MNIGENIDLNKVGQRGFDPVEIANVLRRKATVKVWSWGAHAWMVNKDLWLRFMVSGHHHKGHVYIVLAWNDTFTIYYTNRLGKIVDKQQEIYIDMLVDTLDERIEKIPAYKH